MTGVRFVGSPRGCAYVFALVLASAISYNLWRIPIQVSDSLGEILDAQRSPSTMQSFTTSLGTSAYLRPMRIAQIKALFDLAGGRRYHLVYRGFHVVLLVVLLLLFVRALPVSSSTDAAAAAFALVVLTGLHTFAGFVREAFPINHFLEIAALCALALNLAQSRGGWWIDVATALLFAFAALTLESGLLVWVVVAAAYLAGCRGVSRQGLAACTALLAGYVFVRFAYLETGLPGLDERTAGFFLERLEPDQVQQRFSDSRVQFYAYNVVASALSVLCSEPRNGLLVTTRSWLDGDVPPRLVIGFASSLVTTALIVAAAFMRWRARARMDDADRLTVIAVVVLLANASLSYAYTKDEIVAVAGVFYALAAFAMMRTLIQRTATARLAIVPVTAVALFLLSSAWTVRSAGLHHVMRWQAFRVQGDWTEVPLRFTRERRWPAEASGRALIEQLRADALARPVPNPNRLGEWNNRWFGD